MIDGDYTKRENLPITLHVINGALKRITPVGDCYFSELEGDFEKIFPCRYKNFPYWSLQIADKMNVYNVIMNIKSAIAKDIICTLYGERFTYLVLRPYYTDRNRMKIFADGKLLEIKRIDLPKIKREQIDGHEHHNYSQRLHKLLEMADEINLCNTHGRENLPTKTT
jgi:hypothetical protein